MVGFVKKNDEGETFSAMMRRFKGNVHSSNTLTQAKENQYREKPMSDLEKKRRALRRLRIQKQKKKNLY